MTWCQLRGLQECRLRLPASCLWASRCWWLRLCSSAARVQSRYISISLPRLSELPFAGKGCPNFLHWLPRPHWFGHWMPADVRQCDVRTMLTLPALPRLLLALLLDFLQPFLTPQWSIVGGPKSPLTFKEGQSGRILERGLLCHSCSLPPLDGHGI